MIKSSADLSCYIQVEDKSVKKRQDISLAGHLRIVERREIKRVRWGFAIWAVEGSISSVFQGSQ